MSRVATFSFKLLERKPLKEKSEKTHLEKRKMQQIFSFFKIEFRQKHKKRVVHSCPHKYTSQVVSNSTSRKRWFKIHIVSITDKSLFPKTEPVPLSCPRTFDGWSCWNETPAGETAVHPCPWFVTGFEPGSKHNLLNVILVNCFLHKLN